MGQGNSVSITVDALDKTGAGFAEARKGEKSLGEAAQEATKHLRASEAALEAAESKAHKLALAEEVAAGRTRDLADKTAALRREIEQSGVATAEQARKLERLDTQTRQAAHATNEYQRAAARAASEAREQARAYDKVADNATQAARAVALFGAATRITGGKGGGGLGNGTGISAGFFKGGIGGATSALEGSLGTPVIGPALLAAIAAAAIPTASFVGGAAGGAVGLGIGGAGAGAGLAGAWTGDPQKFSAQWNAAVDGVQHRWLSASKAFGDELTGDLKEADRTLRDLPVERALALSQGLSTPLVQGAGGGVTNFANGAVDALEKVSVIVERVGPKLANLGNAAGDALRMISEGSEGGADALGDLVDGIGYVIRATGLLILGFEKAYQSIHDFESANADFIESVPVVGDLANGLKDSLFGIHESAIVAARALGETADVSGGLTEGWTEAASAATEATLATLGLNDALTENRNLMLAQADADLAVAQGWLDLNEELKDGKKTLDATTQAGLDNQKGILTQIELLERQRQQAIATSDGSVEAVNAANAEYDRQIQKLRDAAVAAGFDASQVDRLIASLAGVPQNTEANITVPGMSQALAQGISLGNALNRIEGTYEANVYVNYHQRGQALNAPLRTGGVGHAAAGGAQDGMTLVGEEGPEFVRLPRGSMVYPHANTNQMLTQGGGRGPAEIPIRFIGDDSALWALFQRALRHGDLTVPAGAVIR